jgi:hypothetical protein
MPYTIRKLPNKELYRVYNKETKDVKAYGTTLKKAQAMIRLLNAVDHGWVPTTKTKKK